MSKMFGPHRDFILKSHESAISVAQIARDLSKKGVKFKTLPDGRLNSTGLAAWINRLIVRNEFGSSRKSKFDDWGPQIFPWLDAGKSISAVAALLVEAGMEIKPVSKSNPRHNTASLSAWIARKAPYRKLAQAVPAQVQHPQPQSSPVRGPAAGAVLPKVIQPSAYSPMATPNGISKLTPTERAKIGQQKALQIVESI